MPRGVDQERPDEGADEDEQEVLDSMEERVLQCGFVEEGEVPGDEHAEPERDRDRRSEQERERAPEGLHPSERCEQVAREEEHRERAANGEEGERHPEVGDQDVLEHVRRLEILLGDRVERGDDPEDDDRDAREEQRPA